MSRNAIGVNKSKNQLGGKQKEMVILDSDNDMDGAKMDDTDEYVQKTLKSKKRGNAFGVSDS